MTYVVGAPINLPEHILTHNFIISLQNVPNNLCFFAACATALGSRYNRYITKAKEFFKMFYGPDKSKLEVEVLIRNYKGFDYVSELDAFEEKFTHAIEIVDYKADKSIELIRRSKFTDRDTIYLNLNENHFSGITHKEGVRKLYM
jgi:hypothetical protein